VDTVETHNYASLQNETLKQVQGDGGENNKIYGVQYKIYLSEHD